jgi:hypothetical protein
MTASPRHPSVRVVLSGVATEPRPNRETVGVLLDATWRLVSAEAGRTDALDRKASNIATFASLLVSLIATLGLRFFERADALWSVLLFVGGLGGLVLAVALAIAALVPRAYLTLEMDYVRRFPTWSQILRPPEQVQGETMEGLIAALARERDLNRAKAQYVRLAFVSLGAGLALIAGEATTLALG